MEGVLYKWTNYISGWQPRWFVLAEGTLSYYDSEEDAWKGCKGSIRISVCEIQVHPTDITRMDLIIPGEQCFYLRALNAAERQKWLVALGTAKACLTDNRTKREKELQENTEAIKIKMSELRLYCDLLLQQVNKFKDIPLNDATDNTEAGSLVKSTCTTFLRTLEECMEIASRTFSPDLLTLTPPGSPPVAAVKPQKIKTVNQTSHHIGEKQRESAPSSGNRTAQSKAQEPEGNPATPENTQTPVTEGAEIKEAESMRTAQYTQEPAEGATEEDSGEDREEEQPAQNLQEAPPSRTPDPEQQHEDQTGSDPATDTSEKTLDETEEVETFFSKMSHRFSDINLDEDNGIPTQAFLESCYAIVPVLDKLGPTVFAPVKIDFVGNIKKIQQKLVSDPDSFPTLQAIVLHEVETDVAQVRNSATEALLWLKRGLKFLKEFLSEVNAGERDIHGALNKAYAKTLRQYHGWVVRGVFALALRAAPSYSGFMAALVSQEGDELKEGFSRGMRRDLGVYLSAMETQLRILDELYEEYSLESEEVV
ncbi:pleckstrin homology domain-containing family A member 8 [Chanos chanos]|uniref:Pleckstrin homology domain-containing family A member 8 n=1 Tax=Chanos chanos TaxID=29144 RepID=A0A6J2VYK4_CHACN|nr:pleckstrin homology domain-containing family A member 8 [Chanos chanos]